MKLRDAWPEGSLFDQVSKQKPRAETNERANEFGTRRLGRGGVSFSVASDHRDRDRCDQPPRSRCTGQHHYTVVRRSLLLSLCLSHSLSPLHLHVLLSHSPSFFNLKPGPPMSPSRDFMLRRVAELLVAANVTGK